MDNVVKPDDNIAISLPHNINEENTRLQGLVGTLRRTVARMVDIENEISEKNAKENVDESNANSPTEAKSEDCNASREQAMDIGEERDGNAPVSNLPTGENTGVSDTVVEQEFRDKDIQVGSPTVEWNFPYKSSGQTADAAPTKEETETDIFLKGLLGEIVVHEDQLKEHREETAKPQGCQQADIESEEFPVFDLSELITEAPEQCFNFSTLEAAIPSLELDFESIMNENTGKSVDISSTPQDFENLPSDGNNSKIDETAEKFLSFLNDPSPDIPEVIQSLYLDGNMSSEGKLTVSRDAINSEKMAEFFSMEIEVENDPLTFIDFDDEMGETLGKSADMNATKLRDSNPKPSGISSEVPTDIPNSSDSNRAKKPEEVKVVLKDSTEKILKFTGMFTMPKDYKVKYSAKMAKFLGIEMEESTEKNAVETEVDEVPEGGNEPEVSGRVRERRKCTLKKKTYGIKSYEGYEKKPPVPAQDPDLQKFGKHLLASYFASMTDYQTEVKDFVEPPAPKKTPECIDLAGDKPSQSSLRDLHFEQLKEFYAEQNRPVCIDLTDDNSPCSSKSLTVGKASTYNADPPTPQKKNNPVCIDLVDDNAPQSSSPLRELHVDRLKLNGKQTRPVCINLTDHNASNCSKDAESRKTSTDSIKRNVPSTSKGLIPNMVDIDMTEKQPSFATQFRATRKRARQFTENISLENDCSSKKEFERTAKTENIKKQFTEENPEDSKKSPFDRAAIAALMEERFNRMPLSEGTRAFMKAAPKMEGCLLPFTSRLLGSVWGNKMPTNTDPSLVSAKRNCELRRTDKEKMAEKASELRVKYGDDVTIFIDEDKEMITTVELYQPVEKGYLAADQKRMRGKPKISMVLEALSSNTLEELCNNFLCCNDYVACTELSHPDNYSQHNLLNRDAAFEKLPTATLLIDDTLYYFQDENKGYNTSILIEGWVKSNVAKGVGPFKYGDLSTAVLGDKTIRYGYPYVYIHLGCCEHTVIFRKSRLINSDDNVIANSYPMIQSIDFPKVFCKTHKKNDKLKNVQRKSTAQYLAQYAVVDCDRLPDNPTFLCQTCVLEFCYDQKGNKIGSFKLYPFLQVHATVKDKY